VPVSVPGLALFQSGVFSPRGG